MRSSLPPTPTPPTIASRQRRSVGVIATGTRVVPFSPPRRTGSVPNGADTNLGRHNSWSTKVILSSVMVCFFRMLLFRSSWTVMDSNMTYPLTTATISISTSTSTGTRKSPPRPTILEIPELTTWLIGNFTPQAMEFYHQTLNEEQGELWLHRGFQQYEYDARISSRVTSRTLQQYSPHDDVDDES